MDPFLPRILTTSSHAIVIVRRDADSGCPTAPGPGQLSRSAAERETDVKRGQLAT